PVVGGKLEELLDLLRAPGGPPVQKPEVPQRRGRKAPGPSHELWGGRLGRTTPPGRRPRSAPQRGSKYSGLGGRQADGRLGRPEQSPHPLGASAGPTARPE